MPKEKLNAKEKEEFLKLLETLCNAFITRDLSQEGMSVEEAAEELEYKDSSLQLLTKNALVKGIVSFLEIKKNEEGQDLGVSVKEIKELIDEALNKKILHTWGEKKLIVTKGFLDYVKKTGKDARLNINVLSFGDEEVVSQNMTMECPYCHKQTKIPTKEGYSDVKCENCKKDFKLLTGKVKKTRGRLTAVVQYGAEPISITLGVGKDEETINFNTNYIILVVRGDKISFVWKKGWLSSGYGEKPKQICNWESREIYPI